MVFQRDADRRKKAGRRKRVALVNFPFFDSHGEPVLWERRSEYGRRKADCKRRWSRKDIPGFITMGGFFFILTLISYWLWSSGGLIMK